MPGIELLPYAAIATLVGLGGLAVIWVRMRATGRAVLAKRSIEESDAVVTRIRRFGGPLAANAEAEDADRSAA